jgi:hypothetical protein
MLFTCCINIIEETGNFPELLRNDPFPQSLLYHFLKHKELMTTTAEVDLTIQDIADRLQITPRTVNLWRSAAEERLGQKLGYKSGKTWHFRPDEIREILKSREEPRSGSGGTSRNFRERTNFSQANNQAEGDVLGGMDAIVASGDQNALLVGQALGQRWNNLMWTAAIQTMQGGMIQMQQQFDELHTSVTVALDATPQLPGYGMEAPQLEGDRE